MWNWQVDRLATIPSDCWCGQMCVLVCALVCVCMRDGAGCTRCHLAVTPRTEALAVPVCRIRTAGSRLRITAHTNHHPKNINAHTRRIRRRCTDAMSEHTNCSLRLSIKLFFFPFSLFVSWFTFSCRGSQRRPRGKVRSGCRSLEIFLMTTEDDEAVQQNRSIKIKSVLCVL